ncbi:copper resistance D family protein [Acinetobacter nematophilus]|uniref:Copper resistance protein D n=1 Tax=Acinetobacter nematophilus TaxID=2994642 RepID=A0A9X3DSK5_9GAMM|nr:CopD family protein [Acinetobacter nematophilus]MCX5466361.1 CopD family protein [Acinetobacter nematophilus]
MISEYWIGLTWLNKVTLYLSMAFITGGAFCYFLFNRFISLKESILQYMRFGASLGLISSIAGFFILVGSFADSGFAGIFNTTYIQILLNTVTGQMLIGRILIFLVLLILLLIKFSQKTTQTSMLERFLFGLFIFALAYGFSQTGHAANLSFFAQILLTIHVILISIWMGALYPLLKATHQLKGLALKDRTHLFGQIAGLIVGLLIVCGASVAVLLLKDIDTLISSPYGNGFMLKIAFVGCILLLAAFNKWFFTPQLHKPQFGRYLGYAIVFEMSIGLMILFTTAYITTVVGIE